MTKGNMNSLFPNKGHYGKELYFQEVLSDRKQFMWRKE